MSNSDLFHVAPIPLKEGSIILPGNWGRILTKIGSRHSAFLSESLLESARQQSFPDYPSRLDAAFACLSRIELDRFASNADQGGLNIKYRVCLEDPNQKAVVANCEASRPPVMENVVPSLEWGMQWAGKYWATAHSWRAACPLLLDQPIREVVTLSPLRVLERLD